MQTIAATLIVRNESAVIARCLRSLKPYVTHFAIVDTGSTDGTQDIIRDEIAGMPGCVIDEPWTDFATARNQALDLARGLGCDYAFVIDADEELARFQDGAEWGPFEADSYAIRLRWAGKEDVWCRRQLFRLDRSWHYEDAIHERSVCDEAKTQGNLLGFEIVSHTDGWRNRDGVGEKAKRDAALLRSMLAERPDDPRLVYYLAQTLINAGEIDEAIELHEQRLTMGGFNEELYVAAAQVAALKEWRDDDWTEVRDAYVRAYEIRPTRAEPLWALAVLHNDRGMHAMGEVYSRAACRIPRPADALVVSESVYKWMAADELAGALGKLNRLSEAKTILKRLDEFPGLPEEDRPRIRENLRLTEAALAAA